jgi:hypothetical protein
MGSANSSAFLQGADSTDSAAQMCPLRLKTVALYPVRWAIGQEEAALPSNFRPPAVTIGATHYCVRKLTPGWVYMFSEVFGTLHEYRVNEQGLITEVQPGVNSVLLPDVDAQSALPAIHHPAKGKVLLKFAQHRWTVRLQELVRTDAQVREEHMQSFDLSGLPENREGVNISETEAINGVVEDFRPEPVDFEWSLTEFAQGIREPDLQGQCKKETEFSYCVALVDEIGITSELGQLHTFHVNLIMNYAEENAYATTTAQMVDALIAREASKKESEDDQRKVTEELKKRIRSEEKDAFVENYHKQIEEYDHARSLVFDDWKRWIDSDQLARKLEFNDSYCARGFGALEQELADILDGYVGAEKGKEDAEHWLKADEGEAGTVGNMLSTVLFLASATNGITQKLKDLPGFDYGSLKIVDSIFDMPAYVRVNTATETLILEFAAPAAKMRTWAKDPQTWPQWKKWTKAVQKRYGIDVHRHQGVTLNTAVELLTAAHRKPLDRAGRNLSEFAMTPLAAGMADARIRNYLNGTLIDMFHLTPDFKDNPFGWLHTRLDPVVENIKQNRGKFIGAVTFFHAINVASLFSGLDKTHQDVMLGDRSVIDRWGYFVSGLLSIGEGVVNLSGLMVRKEYARGIGANLSAAGARVSVVVRGTILGQRLSAVAKGLAKISVKALPYVGVLLSIGLEGRRGYKALDTGHSTMVVLSGVQVGLSIGITYLATLAVAGAVTGAGVAVVLVVGVVLIAVSFVISMVQLYIARSRIEDFLSLSFWGNAPTLRYWDDQSRPSSAEVLEESRILIDQDEGADVRRYFEAELDAFYYMLFSPIVRITEHIGRHWDINRGEHQVMSEMTSFVVYFPGYSDGTCAYSIKLFEVDANWFKKDEPNDITDLFYRMKRLTTSAEGVLFRFDHHNHNKCDQLEMLIEYEKDGRKITGENGIRIILNGNDVEELGVDERLAFEV